MWLFDYLIMIIWLFDYLIIWLFDFYYSLSNKEDSKVKGALTSEEDDDVFRRNAGIVVTFLINTSYIFCN